MVDWIVPAMSAAGALGGALGGQWIAARATRARASEQRTHDNAIYWRAQRASFYKDYLEVVTSYCDKLLDLVESIEKGREIDGSPTNDFEGFRRLFLEVDRMLPLFSDGTVADASHQFRRRLTSVEVFVDSLDKSAAEVSAERARLVYSAFYSGFKEIRQGVRKELGVE